MLVCAGFPDFDRLDLPHYCPTSRSSFFTAATPSALISNDPEVSARVRLACHNVGWFVLPRSTKRIGESSAEVAWMSFVRTTAEEKTQSAAS